MVVEHVLHADAPPDVVFAVAADRSLYSGLRIPHLVDVQVAVPEDEQGHVQTEWVWHLLGVTVRYLGHEEHDRVHRRIRMTASRLQYLRLYEGETTFVAEGAGTCYRTQVRLELVNIGRFAEPWMGPPVRAIVVGMMAAIAAEAERRAGTRPT